MVRRTYIKCVTKKNKNKKYGFVSKMALGTFLIIVFKKGAPNLFLEPISNKPNFIVQSFCHFKRKICF